ncbi:MAG: PilZ domain-containing protein [Desulfurivibrionaceae bacterium]
MILSLDESIQKLKTEILSQDWSLSQKKIEPLLAALACLRNRFSNRKNALAILAMADSILLYAQKRQAPVPSEFIDLLKETLAHLVNMHEDDNFDQNKDTELCQRVYGKFAKLREKAATKKKLPIRPATLAVESSADLNLCPEPIYQNNAATEPAQTRISRTSLAKAPEQAAAKAEDAKTLPIQPGAMLRPITIGQLHFAIAEEDIALIKPLSPEKRKKYIKSSQIPMNDLGGWFRRLSSQMKGPLALLKNGKLTKLILPLMIPRGIGLTDLPDEEANMLVVLSKGLWHGVILCRFAQEAAPLLSLAWAKNGDLVGPVRLEKGQNELQLLNISQLLEREGFLFLPEGRSPNHATEQEGSTMKDKRKNTRVPLQIIINLDFPNRSYKNCKTSDLSAKGVFVLDITGHQLGEHCLVSLHLEGSTSHLSLEMKGEVARIEEHGLALHFYEMDLDSFSHLKNILYYNAEDPDVLDEELTTQFESSQAKD